jgi:thioredoxin reductase (NADPH)
VYIVHRRDKLRASKIMQERAMTHPKIEILWDSVVSKVSGDDVVRSVTIKNLKTDKEEVREAGGLFFAVGHTPNTAFLGGQLDIHDNGYIKVVPGTTKTNIDLVYAAGDVQDHVYRQAITAAGSGCMAAIEVERELSARGLVG